jgi:hypothetical protein
VGARQVLVRRKKKKKKIKKKKKKKKRGVTLFSCKKIETPYPSARNQPRKPTSNP